jgi:hypothetical protein
MPEAYCPLADFAVGKVASSVPVARLADPVPLVVVLTVKVIEVSENMPFIELDTFAKLKLPLAATSIMKVFPSPILNLQV